METGTQFSGSIRIAAALSVVMLLVVIATMSSAPAPQAAVPQQRLSLEQLKARSFVQEIDTDSDGVPDWQEILLGMNVNSADSDGDGVWDGAEEKAPAIADTSITTDVLHRLSDGYVALKNSGAFTPERGKEIASQITGDIRVVTPFNPHTAAELIVLPDTSAMAVSVHRAALQGALKPLLDIHEPDLARYARYLETNNESELTTIIDHAALYRQIANEIVAIPVPRDMQDDHLAAANALAFYASVLDTMIERANDPIASLATLPIYDQSEKYIATTITKITDHYIAKLADTTS